MLHFSVSPLSIFSGTLFVLVFGPACFWLHFLLRCSLCILGTNLLADMYCVHLLLACSLPLNLFLATSEAHACFHVNKKLREGETRDMGAPGPADYVSQKLLEES